MGARSCEGVYGLSMNKRFNLYISSQSISLQNFTTFMIVSCSLLTGAGHIIS